MTKSADQDSAAVTAERPDERRDGHTLLTLNLTHLRLWNFQQIGFTPLDVQPSVKFRHICTVCVGGKKNVPDKVSWFSRCTFGPAITNRKR